MVICDTPVLLSIKKLNSLIHVYRKVFCVNIYGSYKLSKKSGFLAHFVYHAPFSVILAL